MIDKEKVAVLRSLGLSVSDIKNVLDSRLPKEGLREPVIKKI